MTAGFKNIFTTMGHIYTFQKVYGAYICNQYHGLDLIYIWHLDIILLISLNNPMRHNSLVSYLVDNRHRHQLFRLNMDLMSLLSFFLDIGHGWEICPIIYWSLLSPTSICLQAYGTICLCLRGGNFIRYTSPARASTAANIL